MPAASGTSTICGVDDRNCTLQYAAGRIERCPGPDCPFWAEAGCVIGGLRADFEANPMLVSHLLTLRSKLFRAPESLFGLLPPGLRT
jgi:hypothetical protein